jgi:hypothetical protein
VCASCGAPRVALAGVPIRTANKGWRPSARGIICPRPILASVCAGPSRSGAVFLAGQIDVSSRRRGIRSGQVKSSRARWKIRKKFVRLFVLGRREMFPSREPDRKTWPKLKSWPGEPARANKARQELASSARAQLDGPRLARLAAAAARAESATKSIC